MMCLRTTILIMPLKVKLRECEEGERTRVFDISSNSEHVLSSKKTSFKNIMMLTSQNLSFKPPNPLITTIDFYSD